MPAWYGENGQFTTTKFFGMKINRYMHDHGISHDTLAKVAAKNYRNGALNPKAFRRSPSARRRSSPRRCSTTRSRRNMFCAPDEGAAALVLCRADLAHRYTDTPVYVRATALRSRNYGAYEVSTRGRPSRRTSRPPSTPRGPPTRRPGSGPRTST